MELIIPLRADLLSAKESRLLKKKISKLQDLLSIYHKKVSNKAYIEKAPYQVIKKTKDKLLSIKNKIEYMKKNIFFID